jgi:hypothetical protein
VEQLIFFGIIILLSILESVARSRRARQRRESGEVEPEQFEWAQKQPWEQELPTYDEEPSYDDVATHDDEPSYDEQAVTGAAPTPTREREEEQPSAAEIWREIAELAGEVLEPRTEARTRSVPRQSPPLPEPERAEARAEPGPSRRAPLPSRLARSQGGEHLVHRSHLGYGTDPSERAPSEQDGLDPLAWELGANASAVRRQLRGGSHDALRQAVILQEVLGPPVSMREG